MSSTTEPTRDRLGDQVRAGVRWSALSTIAGRFVNPLSTIVLAHLIAPKEFGVFAVALVALNALVSMNDLGVSVALVRWPGDLRAVARTAVTLAIASSAVVCAVVIALAPHFASAMHAPRATPVLRVLALGALLDGIASVPLALLNREFHQGRRAIGEWAGFIVSTTITIALAASGVGVWSLAWGRLIGNGVATLMLVVLAPARPKPGWNRDDARELLRVGLPLAGASLLVFATLNVDYVVVGRVLGSVALGFYTLAFNLSNWPPSVLTSTARRVSIPAFARLAGEPERRRSQFVRILRLLMLVAFPMVALACALAHPLVVSVYGARWMPSARALVVLASLGAVRVAIDLAYDVLAASGRARALLRIQGLWLLLLIPALSIGAHIDGIRGIAFGHIGVALVVVVPCFLVALRAIDVTPSAVGDVLLQPFLAASACGALALLADHLIGNDWVALLVGGFAGLGLYLVLAITPEDRRTLPELVRGRAL